MEGTACKCCGRFLVCKIEDKWSCWYCDSTNVSTWRCPKHGRDVGSALEAKSSQADSPSSELGDEGTILQYFSGTYVFESRATVTQITEVDEKTTEIILDKTIFHPQGGGQPSDIGTISSLDGQGVFPVSMVLMRNRKTVIHSGKFQSSTKFSVGSIVQLSVDQKTREASARIHSAGHLIDLAMAKAGFTFVPTKGYHFPDGPYVEYEGEIATELREKATKQIQDALDGLLATQGGIPVIFQIVPYGDITALCGSTPTYMPVGKPARIVTFRDSLGCPCGGTHVENSSQIGNCRVTKIVKRKNILRVCYEVIPNNF